MALQLIQLHRAMLDIRALDIHLQGVYPTSKKIVMWILKCEYDKSGPSISTKVLLSYYVIHSELRSVVIGKSSRWGYQRRAIKIIVPLILFHVSSASLFCKLTNSICKYVWDSTSVLGIPNTGVRLNSDLHISTGGALDMIFFHYTTYAPKF
ncbi:hypothetical protein H5410_058566 [Solanum commersonii]|uniref:Uncharacterized protein n=1 Tax=Solanum commersonii TaxID=4109 RepID=A0A9J5WTV8_SOLCO|nr:hypothetical protein H5410_058566 [Solanum commersonii]